MIHHAVYCQLQSGVDKSGLENLVRASRSQLLKIPEVLAVRSGRNLDAQSPWQFFFSVEVESREKLRATLENPFYIKLLDRTIQPSVEDSFSLDFELDPSKDLKYS